MMATGNWRIDQMIEQMGGAGIRGAFAYIGASNIVFKAREDDAKPDASKVTPDGLIEYETGLQFNVNIKRGWKMIVSLEPSDTYTVRLYKSYPVMHFVKHGTFGKVMDEATDVYCDQLQSIVEGMYDEAIKTHCGGFIKI